MTSLCLLMCWSGGIIVLKTYYLTRTPARAGVLCGREMHARMVCCAKEGGPWVSHLLDRDGIRVGVGGIMWRPRGDLSLLANHE